MANGKYDKIYILSKQNESMFSIRDRQRNILLKNLRKTKNKSNPLVFFAKSTSEWTPFATVYIRTISS